MAEPDVTIPNGEPETGLLDSSGPVVPAAPPANTGDPDGLTAAQWKQKYDGIWGAAKQQQAKARDTEARLRAELDLAQNAASAVQEEVATMQTQLETIPALQTTASEVAQKDATNKRLLTLMEYPAIVAAATVTEVTAEDGTKSQVRKNPYLEMLMSSTLEGDAWVANVAQIAGTLVVPGTPTPVVVGGITSAPNPVQTPNNRADLLKKAMEAGDACDYLLQERYTNQIADLADSED